MDSRDVKSNIAGKVWRGGRFHAVHTMWTQEGKSRVCYRVCAVKFVVYHISVLHHLEVILIHTRKNTEIEMRGVHLAQPNHNCYILRSKIVNKWQRPRFKRLNFILLNKNDLEDWESSSTYHYFLLPQVPPHLNFNRTPPLCLYLDQLGV